MRHLPGSLIEPRAARFPERGEKENNGLTLTQHHSSKAINMPTTGQYMRNRPKAEKLPSSKLLRSFVYAFRGIGFMFRSQLNARIEMFITLSVMAAGYIFNITATEWMLILTCTGLVLGLEGLNTAIELMADKLHPAFDRSIGRAKDVAAGAVLLASIMAAIIGCIIFIPYLIALF